MSDENTEKGEAVEEAVAENEETMPADPSPDVEEAPQEDAEDADEGVPATDDEDADEGVPTTDNGETEEDEAEADAAAQSEPEADGQDVPETADARPAGEAIDAASADEPAAAEADVHQQLTPPLILRRHSGKLVLATIASLWALLAVLASFVRHDQDVAAGKAIADGTYYLESNAQDLYVLDGFRDNEDVRICRSNGSDAQKWDVSYSRLRGCYTIRKAGTEQSLGFVDDADEGAEVGITGKTQFWDIERTDAGWVLTPQDGGEELAVTVTTSGNEAGVRLAATGDDAPEQAFTLTRAEELDEPDDALVSATGKTLSVTGTVDIPEGAYELTLASNDGLALDVRGASTSVGAQAQLYSRNGTVAQRIWVHPDDEGFYTLYVVGTGQVIGTGNDTVTPGSLVRQGRGIDARTQWAACGNADGTVTFVNRATGLALGVDAEDAASGMALLACEHDGSANQRFGLVETGVVDAAASPTASGGVYELRCAGSPGMVLDVTGASSEDGAGVQVHEENGSRAQTFQMVDAGTDDEGRQLYRIRTASSGGWLTASSQGTQVMQTGSLGDFSSADAWYFAWDGAGLALTNAATGLVLDVAGASYANATAVQTWTSNASQAQRFLPRETTLQQPIEGYCLITSGLSDSLYLGTDESGACLTKGKENLEGTNLWYLRQSGDGYVIENYATGEALDASGEADGDAALQTGEKSGGDSQLWYPCIEDDGNMGFVNASTGEVLAVAGGSASDGAAVGQEDGDGSAGQQWSVTRFTGTKVGYQNPEGYYQVSCANVVTPAAEAPFDYVSECQIDIDATREECVEAFIARAYDYLGTPYRWDYACAPGVGVDCIGLVMQCCYAVGMDLGEFNPAYHIGTGSNGWHSHDANNMWNYGSVLHVSLADRQRGDVISWNGHVAIYLGDDRILEANWGVVRISSLWAYGTPRGCLRFFQ